MSTTYQHPRSPPLKKRRMSEQSDVGMSPCAVTPKRIRPIIYNSEMIMEHFDRDPRDDIEYDADGNMIDPVGYRSGNPSDDEEDTIIDEEETKEGSSDESEDDGMGDGTDDNPRLPGKSSKMRAKRRRAMS
jgi:hypothetical protein